MTEQVNGISWLIGQAGKRKGKLAASLILAIISVLCGLVPYYIVAEMIEQLLGGNREFIKYLVLAAWMLLFFAGKALFHGMSTIQSHAATFAIIGDIRKSCTDKLARMPLGDVLAHSPGALKSTLVERIDSIETTLAHIIPEFTSNLLAPVILLVSIFLINWRMGLAVVIPIPLGFFCYMGMMIDYEKYFSRTLCATKRLNETTVEYINGIEVIKAFGKTESSYQKFADAAKEGAASYVDWMKKCNVFHTFALVLMPATMLTALPIGGILFSKGLLSAADFITIIVFSVALIEPVITCMSYADDLEAIGPIANEIKSIMDSPEMIRPETLKAEHVPKDNSIVLDKVHFGYQEKEIIHGMDMRIEDGNYVAFVGPSGSGKSTVAKLIAGLWDVKEGSISLGGVDIRNIPLEDYSDRIAYVSQDNYLFNVSVRDNIRMGKTDGTATDEEVEAVAKMSGCHEFIMELENGYDTVVGSSGGHLSGGERQRISIARAMLKNAPIIILDEATAYTDPENEAVIQRSVAKLVQGKTLIVIAHRLSTVKDADCLYCFKDGKIQEAGTHDELLEKNGLYKLLWEKHIASKDSDAEGGTEND
jgi:ATP-binding cassette subfamily B protein